MSEWPLNPKTKSVGDPEKNVLESLCKSFAHSTTHSLFSLIIYFIYFYYFNLLRCQSGRMCWSRKPVYRKVSRVQIPLSAPRKKRE